MRREFDILLNLYQCDRCEIRFHLSDMRRFDEDNIYGLFCTDCHFDVSNNFRKIRRLERRATAIATREGYGRGVEWSIYDNSSALEAFQSRSIEVKVCDKEQSHAVKKAIIGQANRPWASAARWKFVMPRTSSSDVIKTAKRLRSKHIGERQAVCCAYLLGALGIAW